MAISGKLIGDFSSFIDAVAKAQVSLKGFESGASQVSTSLNRMGDSFSGRKVMQEATLMAKAIESAGGVSKLTGNELERAGAKAAEAAEKMKAMGKDVPPGIQKIADAAKAAETNTGQFAAKLSSVASTATTVGAGLTAAITVPLVGMGLASLKASMDFETAFAGVRKTVSGTPAELAALNTQFRDMATTTPVAAVGLAKIGEMAGQLGVKKDAILGFTKTIVDISVATNLTADEAGSSFARLANVLKMPQAEFANLGSAVVALGNFGASTEQEMLDMGQRISAAGATANMTAPQVLGIANALSSVGINAEAGGTAISKAINQISSDVATGGGKLETFAKISGMSAASFRTAWRDDAGIAFSQFMQGLANAREQGGEELLGLMDELGFSEVRLRNAFLSAANAGSLMADSIALGTRAFAENTELTRASEERYKTAANQLLILKNNLTEVAIELGDVFAPALVKAAQALVPMVKAVGELAKGFGDLPGPAQAAAVGIAAIAASVGPFLLAVAGAAFTLNQFNALLITFPAIGIAANAAMAALTGGMLGMAATAAGVLVLAGAVGTLAYGLTRLVDISSGGKLSGWLTPFLAGTEELQLKTQEAGASFDVLAMAQSRTTEKVISLSQAMEINAKWVKDHNAAAKAGAEAQTAFVGPLQASGAAALTLSERVKALSAEQRAAIMAGVAQSDNAKEIAKNTGIAAEVVSQFIRQQKGGTSAGKEFAAAMAENNAVGEDYTDTLKKMGVVVVNSIEDAINAGVQQGKLATIFRLSVSEINAVKTGMEAKKKADEASTKALDSTIKSITEFRSVGVDAARAVTGAFDVARQMLLPFLQSMGAVQLSATQVGTGMATMQGTSIAAGRAIATAMTDSARSFIPLRKEQQETIDKMRLLGASVEEMAAVSGASIGQVGTYISALRSPFGELSTVLGSLSGDFTQMATIGGEQFQEVARTIGLAVKAAESLSKAMDAMGMIGKSGAQGGGFNVANLAAVASGWVGVAVAVYEVVSAIMEARRVEEEAANRRGWAELLAMDFQAATVFSEALSESVSKLYGQLQNMPVFGTTFNDTDIKNLAEALKLVDVIKELGGASALTAEQLEEVRLSAARLFDLIEIGGPLGVAAFKTLDTVLMDLEKETIAAGGLVSQFFLNMVAQAAKAGVVLPQVAALFKQFGTDALAAFNTVISGQGFSVFADLKKGVEDAEKALEKLGANADLDLVTAAAERFRQALFDQFMAGEASRQGLEDLGVQAIATFAAAVASGATFAEALHAASPGITALKKAFDDLGISTNDVGLQALFMQNTILQGNPQLLAAISGLVGQSQALFNMGLLNVETFAAMERTGAQMYSRLQAAAAAAGGGTKEALLPMQEWLRAAAAQAERLGIPLDENTEQMIAQSKELGIWKAIGPSTQQQMIDLTTTLADRMTEVVAILTRLVTDDPLGRTQTSTEGAEAAADNLGTAVAGVATMFGSVSREAQSAASVAVVALGAIEQAARDAAAAVDRIIEGSGFTDVGPAAEEAARTAVNWLHRLEDSAWDAAYAVDAILRPLTGIGSLEYDLELDRLREFRDAVDGISFGDPGGGIKEIPLEFDRAGDAASRFAERVTNEMDTVREAVDDVVAALRPLTGIGSLVWDLDQDRLRDLGLPYGPAGDAARILPFVPRETSEPRSLGPAQISRINAAGSASGAAPVTIVVQAWDGASVDSWLRKGGAKKIADATVPEIPGVVKRYIGTRR